MATYQVVVKKEASNNGQSPYIARLVPVDAYSRALEPILLGFGSSAPSAVRDLQGLAKDLAASLHALATAPDPRTPDTGH